MLHNDVSMTKVLPQPDWDKETVAGEVFDADETVTTPSTDNRVLSVEDLASQ